MQVVIDIPDEQVKKSLEESKYINEDEGEKGFVCIMMLYTNGQINFVDVSRKTDFYSCEYTTLPKGHGRLIDANDLLNRIGLEDNNENRENNVGEIITLEDFDFISTIIDADKESEVKG